MSCASHVLRHSRKIHNTSNLVRHDNLSLVRWFSNEARLSADKGDDILKFQKAGFASPKERFRGTAGFSNRCRTIDPPMISVRGTQKANSIRTGRKLDVPMAGILFNTRSSWSPLPMGRCFSTEAGLPPHQEVGMPSLSPTMTEGNIARWLKKEGDRISPGEVLCEVETDKATVEMECMEEGYLAKILKGDGASGIKVGEVIAITVEEEEDVSKFKDYKPAESVSAAPVKEPSTPSPAKDEAAREPVTATEQKVSKPSAAPAAEGRIFASPLARKIAEEHNVPIADIKGTGPDGVIVKADIEDYLASRGKEAPAPKAATATATSLDYADIPLSQIRKVTASRLLLSKQTIPHYYLTVDTCVDKLMELRSQLNSLQEASGGKRISVNDLVIKAAALALRKVPQCNSSWTNDYIRQYHNVNINVAVQTDNGLYVPVIRDADKKGLSKIADEVKYLAQKAKDNSLKPEDYEGGTFTVSNLGGPFGIKQFCAIINPPQAGILAVGSAERRVVPDSGPEQFKFASFMSVTLSCDHRVIDGAIGAEWLKAFKGYIENPESMLL
ncbi:dihydrolipoyllysine-residue acetyltransferase component 3 of pyruvate dehydrogenase complex, mitochondrial-like [Coffea eugenioides]|uniref:dihydrolipoyllysine-residue acetyltransferase component 3 of pyruvate dehydrogenase complex, mitochondrial-like n=1 Tax=Coffea eugenioides TaxID=49369 RepID=UPI000F60DBEC|nr:dihydrolipoyllysine-residue acetyltransferase component 3 of pyruvate dehydrogenase complex, mitochondrial-like [Coffea eugenioides]XP_027168701.1 dihydrolipoyllysine-residue acetyltransferase component 3 of pyruvate dehydrogenase complex, mitochondrial-like [Coffea eugenioides]XP_027168702.1 dihydrolipoyllysine-residue acetyltransferase component 3 of pyruvate dehydrogenase complex, mitochondrial-like [Coffea eugenioides]